MKSIQSGVAADGLATLLSGCLGSTGQNSATSGIGVSSATGATSRWIAIALSIWLLIMASSPILTTVLAIMPDAVLGGALLFSACFMLSSGLQLLNPRHLNWQGRVIASLSLLLAVGRVILPQPSMGTPNGLQIMLSSGLTIGICTALFVNGLIRCYQKVSSRKVQMIPLT